MGEAATIKQSRLPVTISSIKKNLKNLGVVKGDVVIVHSSLSKIGWVAGGPVAVIDAFMEVLTDEGTIVVPTHSSDNTNAANWTNPPVPESWVKIIMDEFPPYRPEITPTRRMGVIPETFRKHSGVLRSMHPVDSFAAWGKNAKYITDNHQLEDPLGKGSPLGKIYELNGKIILIGVFHDRNTSLHLAEDLANYPSKKTIIQTSAILENGKRVRKTWEELDAVSDDFKVIGKYYEKIASKTNMKIGKIGYAETRLIVQRDLVDFATKWMEKNRK